MKNLNIYHILKFIFSIWGLQVFAPFFTSIGSVSHPGYLPFLCSNGKYCLAEMDGNKVGECQWDEIEPMSTFLFIGRRNEDYYLVSHQNAHLLGSIKPSLELSGRGLKDSLSGMYALYVLESNYLSEFNFISSPMHYSRTPYFYGSTQKGLFLYNMENNENYYAQGEEIRLHPPYAFIKRGGNWIAHDLKLKMLYPEGRQSYLVHNDDLVMYDELEKDIKINPLFFHKDKGMYERADSSFSLLLPYQYLGYNISRSESLLGYLVSKDSTGNQILYYPDKRRVFEERTEWSYDFGKIYWIIDSTTGLLSYDRLNDIVIPERIDSVNVKQKLFIKYLNEYRDSFRVYDSDLNVSGDMKGQLYDFFWDYFFLTIDGRDSLGICRMYDWKGNLIRADNVSEFRSFRTAEVGKTIIRFYGDTLIDVFNLPENFRNMNYSFGYEVSTHNDTNLYGWNDFFSFAYDLKSKAYTGGFRLVDQPDPNKYQKFTKLPDPPHTTYKDFSVIKENGRYLINCTNPGVNCRYEADEYEVDEYDSIGILIMTDYKTDSTIVINSAGRVIFKDHYDEGIWVHSFYGNNHLFVEDSRTDTVFLTIFDGFGDTLLLNGILEEEMGDELVFYRENESEFTSLFVLSSNVKILDYKKCPMLADSIQNRYVHLFEDFGLPYPYWEKAKKVPILKYPWILRFEDHGGDSNFFADTDHGRIYINIHADNPYFADSDIIQQVSFEGRVIDCSGK